MAEKPCKKCGTPFIGTREWQAYCTPLCRDNSPTKQATTRAYQASRREDLNAIKLAAGCAECGYADHPAALQFNHVRGVKSFNISQDPKRAWADILAEVAKCEILCANCHAVHTHTNNHYHTKRKEAQIEP